MEHIKKTIQGVIEDIKKERRSGAENTFALLRKNLSRQERRHIKCCFLRDGIITVNVDSSAWLYQLRLKKDDFLKKLGIKDIRFRLGETK